VLLCSGVKEVASVNVDIAIRPGLHAGVGVSHLPRARVFPVVVAKTGPQAVQGRYRPLPVGPGRDPGAAARAAVGQPPAAYGGAPSSAPVEAAAVLRDGWFGRAGRLLSLGLCVCVVL